MQGLILKTKKTKKPKPKKKKVTTTILMRNAISFSLAYLLCISLLSFAATSATSLPLNASSPPYIPSYIFSTPQQQHVYMLLSGSSANNGTVEFLTLNISSGFNATNPRYSVLLDQVPFYGGNGNGSSRMSFVPVMDGQGIIKVYTGDCETTASQGTLWQFTPDKRSAIGNGSWNRLPLTPADRDTAGVNYMPAIHMASGFAASSSPDANSTSSVYTFGGMCPLSLNVSGYNTGERSSLDYYSQAMIFLEPYHDDANNTLAYKYRTTGGRALPVPEAGFTLTPLQAASAITSSGGILEQQSFLLVGGHSSNNSFITMARLGLFSLPQNSWSFVNVGDDDDDDDDDSFGNPPLMPDPMPIQPRSGHSAVLSPDGTKVVIFGGYTGNTSTAAQPQLAILEVGEGYGGTGPWAWKAPSPVIPGLGSGGGIYGHGATVLPGGMMMVVGGYTIPPISNDTSNPRMEKRAAAAARPQVYLYNITSNTWATSYANPNILLPSPSGQSATTIPTTIKPTAATSEPSTASTESTTAATALPIPTTPSTTTPLPTSTSTPAGHSNQGGGGALSTGQRAGLGVGLGVGAPLLALAALCALCGMKRRRRTTESRDNDSTVQEYKRSHSWSDPNMSNSFREGSFRNLPLVFPWARSSTADLHHQDEEASAEQAGLLGIATTDMHPDNQRQSTSRNSPQQQKAGNIQPIDECEEDEEHVTQSLMRQYQGGEEEEMTTMDQFRYPEEGLLLLGSRDFAISGVNDSPRDNKPPSRGDHTAAGDTTDRTAGRRLSIQQTPPSTSSSGEVSSNVVANEKRISKESFSTARTRQSLHQGERESLLGGGDDRGWYTPREIPTRTKSHGRPKASELIGTVRRALSGRFGGGVPLPMSPSYKRYRSITDTPSKPATTIKFDRSPTVTPASSHRRPRTEPPRRAVSASAASAAAYRYRKGAKDWGFQPQVPSTGHHHNRTSVNGAGSDVSGDQTGRGEMREICASHPLTRIPKIIPQVTALDELYAEDASGDKKQQQQQQQQEEEQEAADNDASGDSIDDYDGEDWDVEAAAEQRQVQMTFTVPRSRLRVVNVTPRDMDNYSEAGSSIRKTSNGERRVS